jgi:hypothetical protein
MNHAGRRVIAPALGTTEMITSRIRATFKAAAVNIRRRPCVHLGYAALRPALTSGDHLPIGS